MAAGYGGNAGTGSTLQQRGGNRSSSRYQSLFYRDLNMAPSSAGRTPSAAAVRGDPAGHTSAAAALWRDNISGADPPPPPCFTLEDRITPPEPMPGGESLSYRSPESSRYSDGKSPVRTPHSASSVGRGGLNLGYGDGGGSGHFNSPLTASSPSWWPPLRERSVFESGSKREGERENGISMPGVVHQQQQLQHQQQQQQGGLLTLPTPREIIRPDVQITPFAGADSGGEEGDEWVTVYGFPGEDTNSVLREFEKCGPIVRHVAGPPSSNWLHIQYQSRQDAQRALRKNGMQLYGALIIGVKPVDALQRQALVDKAQRTAGFMVMPPKSSGKGTASGQASARPYYLQAGDAAARPTSTIASPSKSTLSKIVDLVFGF